jgi:RNase P subunit RPR2
MANGDDRKEERKERVIHTRISEALDEEIRKKATALGLSVSNLVRNTLLNTFGLMEDIMADSAELARAAGRKRRPREHEESSPAGTILGWQEMVLNRNAVCERCNVILPKGSQAAVAVRDGSGPRTIICPRCLEEVTHDDGSSEPTA